MTMDDVINRDKQKIRELREYYRSNFRDGESDDMFLNWVAALTYSLSLNAQHALHSDALPTDGNPSADNQPGKAPVS